LETLKAHKLQPIQYKALALFNIKSIKEFLLVGGSRSGKTFISIYAILVIAFKYPGSRHLIARFRFRHVKDSVWKDTLRKVLKLCFPMVNVTWNNSDYYIELPNGSQVWIGGLDDSERVEKILGMEFLTVLLNEASQISHEAYLTIKTRLAQRCERVINEETGETITARNILFVDENPPSKKHWTYRVFIEHMDPEAKTALDGSRYAHIIMNPDDNAENISADYLETLASLPLRKRLRFLEGKFSDDAEGALWNDDLINGTRITRNRDGSLPVTLKRIVVALDPAVTSKDTSDDTGIVVAGVGYDNHLYVLEDATDTYKPLDWAKKAVSLYHQYKADRIVAEVNNGGELVETVLRNVDSRVSYSDVHATRDKLTRAEPVAALYEQGKAHHVDQLLDLELEMTSWESKKGERSPNRIDALVWAATELCLSDSVITGRAKFHFKKKN
jgi:ADP-ribose pyrophosphatase YjhB (NUDIX family)